MRIWLLIFISVLFLSLNNCSFAQITNGKSKGVGSLVISIPKADPQVCIPQIVKKFKKMPHVILDGYCERQNLIFFKTDNDNFFEVLIALKELELVYYIRKDITDELLKTCNDLSTIENEN